MAADAAAPAEPAEVVAASCAALVGELLETLGENPTTCQRTVGDRAARSGPKTIGRILRMWHLGNASCDLRAWAEC
jgi:hypothetical protein